MLDLRLEYIGGGKFRTLYHTDFEEAEQSFKVGEKLRAQITHERSVGQNKFFHAMIQIAHANQSAGQREPSWQLLKNWLLIEAGWCTVKRFSPKSITPGVARVLRQIFDGVTFEEQPNGTILMKIARSVRFGKGGATSDEMNEIVNRVRAIICAEIIPGMDPEQLMRAARLRCGGKAEQEAA